MIGSSKFDELRKLQSSLNASSARFSHLWMSFLVFCTLLLITVGSVTHKHLFLELPLKLPVLNVELPLKGFFATIPSLLLAYHFYLLIQLHLLKFKLSSYDEKLQSGVGFASDRNSLLMELDDSIFIEAIARGNSNTPNIGTRTSSAIVYWTAVALPLLLLVEIQLIFLPYHSPTVSWVHRIAILLDTTVLYVLWPYNSTCETSWRYRILSAWVPAIVLLFSWGNPPSN